MSVLPARRGLRGTAHAARRRMGLTPTPAAMRWSSRVLLAVHRVLAGCPDDADQVALRATLARLDGLQPAFTRARSIVRSGARRYR